MKKSRKKRADRDTRQHEAGYYSMIVLLVASSGKERQEFTGTLWYDTTVLSIAVQEYFNVNSGTNNTSCRRPTGRCLTNSACPNALTAASST